MKKREQPMQVRLHERTYLDREGVCWGASMGPLSRAFLCDISASGVGLSLAGAHDVTHGDSIRVLSKDSPMPRRARVVRLQHVTHEGRSETRLGCRWTTRGDRNDLVKRHRRRTTRMHNPKGDL